MPEKMNNDEQHAVELLKQLGLKAEKIPESDEKSPDFIVKTDSKKVLIELKTKYDSPEFVEKRDTALDLDGEFEHVGVLRRTNTISGLITEAYKQLKQRKTKYGTDECYVFLLGTEPYANDKYYQFYYTVYGVKFLMPLQLRRTAPTPRDCFFYEYNDFYRYRDVIDGAVISNGRLIKLCLNPFSAAYDGRANNEFVNAFKTHVVDPYALEEADQVFVVDSDIDRSDTNAIDHYLMKKYDLEKVTAANFPSIKAEFSVKIDDE